MISVKNENAGAGGQVPGLLGLQGALSLGRDETGELFSRFVNPGLKTLLSTIGFDKKLVRAQGIEVWDESGKRYLDFLGGYGSLPFGHNPPEVLEGLREVGEHPNFLQAQVSAFQAALAHDLAQIAPGDLEISFFCNSGTEAVEGALKLARGVKHGGSFVYCTGAFHGKTLGSLSVGGREKYKKPFGPLLDKTVEIPFGDAEALERELRKGGVAAFIVEPIQGEGGVCVPSKGYLQDVRGLTRKYGALLILDEVQTGFGRTGKMFACDHEGVVPDILCLAKALGGGVVPVGATVTTKAVWEKAYGGLSRAILHTSTFGGGARACAAALSTIQKIVGENLPQKAKEMGERLVGGLRVLQDRYSLLEEVRGMGLLVGLEFKKPASTLANLLTAGALNRISQEYAASLVASLLMDSHGIITAYTLNNPNVMRLEPPLVVTEGQIDYVLNALEDVFSKNKGFFSLAASLVKRMQ